MWAREQARQPVREQEQGQPLVERGGLARGLVDLGKEQGDDLARRGLQDAVPGVLGQGLEVVLHPLWGQRDR